MAKGRPTKRTAATLEKLCQALKVGSTRRAACMYAGISEDSFANYMRASSDFSDAIARAEGEIQVRMAGVIFKGAIEGNVQAAIFWHTHHPMTKHDWRLPNDLDLKKLTTEQLLELAEELERRVDSPGDRLAVERGTGGG